MKKELVLLIISLFIFLGVKNSYGADSTLFDAYNKILQESNEIKPLLAKSKDVILVSSLWDSCLIALTQLDGYFSMVGIANTIKKEELSKETLKYLTDWLYTIKKTNQANLKGLEAISHPLEAETAQRVTALNADFSELNNAIDTELLRMLKTHKMREVDKALEGVQEKK